VNAVAALGGLPVACLRLSFADARERHRGVSHHTVSALTSVALAGAIVAVPRLELEKMNAIERELDSAGVWTVHSRREASISSEEIPDLRGLRVRTMGRGIDEDPAFFAAAFAAGYIAFELTTDVLEPTD